MNGASDAGDRSSDRAGTHVVGVYERDADLVTAVVPYLMGAFADDGTAIVIATPAHRAAIDAEFDSQGVPRADLERAGRYRVLDARATLDRLMRHGRLDPCAFRDLVGDIVAAAARTGRAVRLFGEMVALLWDDGDRVGALELERLWNDLADREEFALFCGYAMASFDTADDLAAVKAVCDQHRAVAPLPAYMPPVTDGPADEFTRLFVTAPTAPHDVRAFLRFVLASWGEHDIEDEAGIVASELATNAVRHARSPFRVSVTRGDEAIRIAVRDASFAAPEQRTADHSVMGGRGVRLIAALSCAWGTDSEIDGKTVWAELRPSA